VHRSLWPHHDDAALDVMLLFTILRTDEAHHHSSTIHATTLVFSCWRRRCSVLIRLCFHHLHSSQCICLLGFRRCSVAGIIYARHDNVLCRRFCTLTACSSTCTCLLRNAPCLGPSYRIALLGLLLRTPQVLLCG
jgi:hypothetical protein